MCKELPQNVVKRGSSLRYLDGEGGGVINLPSCLVEEADVHGSVGKDSSLAPVGGSRLSSTADVERVLKVVMGEVRKRQWDILRTWVSAGIVAYGILVLLVIVGNIPDAPSLSEIFRHWQQPGSPADTAGVEGAVDAARKSLLPVAGLIVALVAVPALGGGGGPKENVDRRVRKILLQRVLWAGSYATAGASWLLIPVPRSGISRVPDAVICVLVGLLASTLAVSSTLALEERRIILIDARRRLSRIDRQLTDFKGGGCELLIYKSRGSLGWRPVVLDRMTAAAAIVVGVPLGIIFLWPCTPEGAAYFVLLLLSVWFYLLVSVWAVLRRAWLKSLDFGTGGLADLFSSFCILFMVLVFLLSALIERLIAVDASNQFCWLTVILFLAILVMLAAYPWLYSRLNLKTTLRRRIDFLRGERRDILRRIRIQEWNLAVNKDL